MSITEGHGHVDCFASFRYSVGGSSTQKPCENLGDSSTCRKEVGEEEGGGRGGRRLDYYPKTLAFAG